MYVCKGTRVTCEFKDKFLHLRLMDQKKVRTIIWQFLSDNAAKVERGTVRLSK